MAGGDEGDGVRNEYGEGLDGGGEAGGEGELAGVGEGVADAELGFAGANGEEEAEVAGVGAGDGGGLDGHAALGDGPGAADQGAWGEKEVEAARAELGDGRGGVVKDLEDLDDVELAGGGLDVQLFDAGGDGGDDRGRVVDGDLDGVGPGLDGLEVGGLLMGDADEVHAIVRNGEGEVAAGVGGGAGGLLHALLELDEDDLVPGGGFAAGFVDDGAGDGCGGVGEKGREEHGEGGGETADLAWARHVFKDTSGGEGASFAGDAACGVR